MNQITRERENFYLYPPLVIHLLGLESILEEGSDSLGPNETCEKSPGVGNLFTDFREIKG